MTRMAPLVAERPATPVDEPGGSAPAELERLYVAHRETVRRRCLRLLRDAHEAEDATQQVFLCAYRSLLSGVRPLHPESWLRTIARNECFGRLGRRSRAEVAIEEADATTPDAFESLTITEALDTFRETLWELPPQQREALTLRELGGLSQREISGRMALSEPAVETLLVRARRGLRARLATLSLPTATAFSASVIGRSLERLPDIVAGSGGAARVGVTVMGIAAVFAGASVTQHDLSPQDSPLQLAAPPSTPAGPEAPAAVRKAPGPTLAPPSTSPLEWRAGVGTPSRAAQARPVSPVGNADGGGGSPVAREQGSGAAKGTGEAEPGAPSGESPGTPSDESESPPAELSPSPDPDDEPALAPGEDLAGGPPEAGGGGEGDEEHHEYKGDKKHHDKGDKKHHDDQVDEEHHDDEVDEEQPAAASEEAAPQGDSA